LRWIPESARAQGRSPLEDDEKNWVMQKEPALYILASKRNGTLYVGVTSDIIGRVSQHKQHLIDGFTKKYAVHSLVHFEFLDDMDSAICREKQLKKWSRARKIELIERSKPDWKDLYSELSGLTDA
jgi:putative endonuclease